MFNRLLTKIVAEIGSFVKAIRTINQKYKNPRIQMTPMVKISLLVLRLYLIGMVLILLYKFVTLIAP